MESSGPHNTEAVVLYDEACPLCRRTVVFARQRDPGHRLKYLPLQSPPGRALLSEHGLDPNRLDSVVLCESGHVWQRSTAALRVCRHLTAPWPLLSAALVVPRPIRDWIYDYVARHRVRSH